MKKLTDSLSFKNIKNRPVRSMALVMLCALLSFSVFCGTLVVRSLSGGLESMKRRLGADIMVVPFEATTKSDIALENVVLLGNMGYFYMERSVADKIMAREGVERASTQCYLSTVSSGCCSLPVQIVGFDPETDFTITPWIREGGGVDLGDGEVIVGHKLNAFPGDTLTFYGVDVKVAAKLAETGTDLDTAIYTGENTIRRLIQASVDLNLNTQKVSDPAKVTSCVLLSVADGYSVDEVLNDINIHVRKVKAYRTSGMMETITSSLENVSRFSGVLAGSVWLFSLVILVIVFSMNVNERKREFAVLRTAGASAKQVARIVTGESVLLSCAGSAIGVLCGLFFVVPFSGLIGEMLDVPFLRPGALQIALLAVLSLAAGVACGALASIRASHRISRTDAGLALREA